MYNDVFDTFGVDQASAGVERGDVFGGFDVQNEPSGPRFTPGAYGWHWPLTLLSIVLVSGLSFLMAFLTKGVQERSVWLMGLIFMVPAGALFLAAMSMEFAIGAMTPKVSRPVQIRTAAIATAATFLVACLCDAIYLFGGFVGECSDNLLFLVYETGSTGGTPTDRAVMEVLDELQARAGSDVQAGLFMFDRSTAARNSTVPLGDFDDEQRDKMYNALINGHCYQATAYGVEKAYQMVEQSGTDRATKIIIICDEPIVYTPDASQARLDRDVEWMKSLDIALYYMGKGETDEGMYYVTSQTGGFVVSDFTADNVLENLRRITKNDGDMLRADTTSAKVLTGVMLILEGLTIGLGLMLLLSVTGQKRVQAIISPLLAIAAFLLVKIVPVGDTVPQWVLEGAAFSLLGIVFMKRNSASYAKRTMAGRSVAEVGPDSFSADGF